MDHLLNNIIWASLLEARREDRIIFDEIGHYDPQIAPFVGMNDYSDQNLEKLKVILPENQLAIIFVKEKIQKLERNFKILGSDLLYQMVYNSDKKHLADKENYVQSLGKQDVAAMKALIELTKPGPFADRTVEFGNYKGIFENGQLVSMNGFRMKCGQYREISAVCTHPDFLGKGYATILLKTQINDILDNREIPFLHVRQDNSSAISVYKKLGFEVAVSYYYYVFVK